MQQIFRDKKIEKAHTKKELEKLNGENKARGWVQISEIKEDYGDFQVWLKLNVTKEKSRKL